MKTLAKTGIFFLLLFPLWGLAGCEKDDDTPEIEKLPSATQTGAGTFACLVNGQAFIHNDGLINCFYQYVDGGYYFGIQGINENKVNNISSIYIATDKKEITEGETYQLLNEDLGNVYGGGGYSTSNNYISLSTNENYTGEMTITKLDFENYVVSGTFWFNLKHPETGDTIKIRHGRFDAHFGT